MNILVTGCNGQLGNHMKLASAALSGHQFWFTDVEELDITDEQAVAWFVKDRGIELLVNCAAYTNVDKAEDDEATADLLNHKAVAGMARIMKEVGGTLIHISTDYVFGGNIHNTPCTEEESTNPTGAYGRTKLAGEEAIKASGCQYIIIRTAWLYSEYGKNFVKTMLDVTATQPRRKVVFDQVGTPTYAGDLAKAICHIISTKQYEGKQAIYHFSNEGVCSWFDFTKEIARQSGHTDCEIESCHSWEFPSKVIRPSFSVLDKSKIKSELGVAVPYWTDSLTECLKNLGALKM